MKRYITLIFVALMATQQLAAEESTQRHTEVQTQVQTQGALIYCKRLTHNFGTVNRRGNESIFHIFTIENRGDEPLIIKRVERSCSCMKASLSKRPIAPGESREMKVSYEVRKMPPGLFSKVVQIYSTSRSDTGFTQFTITGRSVDTEPHRR
ncbi:MAG: DUF1573 domain-containing protein [Rikenellaceae bacterium]